ncbi:HNH endonuclease [Alicyclobacillus macrosporangiidus]|uniref:HNH endonuclease n=1 Tax=Alicyclobacillus macrosporangiidus TaxID=392015 RepID=UPI000495B6B8|nr:HNH endonuclease [Alicyclobacillus macrosporangiidus]
MKIFVGLTDNNWYNYLCRLQPDEVNFWQPTGRRTFRAIERNGLFLFKLHSPLDYIVGGGFFVRHSFLPVSLAWEAFGQKNGTPDFEDFIHAIHKYRKTDRFRDPDPVIGCIILASPFFFPQHQWIPAPEDWKPNIVQGKTYDTEQLLGRRLYESVIERLPRSEYVHEQSESRYGSEYLARPRIGQGSFRVLVTEAYQRRCAITGEKTLPVLDAAHIKPYAQDGPHLVSNGLLLRKDLHVLFDRGYLTIDEHYRIEVSRRLKDDYGNGRDYYALHGKPLAMLPERPEERPGRDYLRWHNEHVFLA